MNYATHCLSNLTLPLFSCGYLRRYGEEVNLPQRLGKKQTWRNASKPFNHCAKQGKINCTARASSNLRVDGEFTHLLGEKIKPAERRQTTQVPFPCNGEKSYYHITSPRALPLITHLPWTTRKTHRKREKERPPNHLIKEALKKS